MLFTCGTLLSALSLAAPLPTQDDPAPSGFEALANDPFTAGLFREVLVTPGPSVRTLARNVEGSRDDVPFVNVLRMADARRFRGRVISVQLPVRLDAATVDTSARLWVRVLRADGTVAFEDTGEDRTTSSSEWTKLASTGAIADDATDLWFGLIVEGTTLVHMDQFAIEVRERVSAHDARHAVPERWTLDPDVRSARVLDSDLGLDLRVTSFVPPGHGVRELPHVWLVRGDANPRWSYAAGRALLEGMRLGQDPPAIVSVVEPMTGNLPEAAATPSGWEAVQKQLGTQDAALVASATHVASTPSGMLVSAPTGADAGAILKSIEGSGPLHAERVLVRWADTRQAAEGNGELASILFDASIAALEPWGTTAVVRQVSHSLVGHSCGHDHSHDHGHGHDHTHDH